MGFSSCRRLGDLKLHLQLSQLTLPELVSVDAFLLHAIVFLDYVFEQHNIVNCNAAKMQVTKLKLLREMVVYLESE